MDRVDPVTMTDLGEQLRSADGEALRSALVARLDALIADIARETSVGVSGPEFTKLQKIDQAARTARQIVDIYR